MIALVVGALLVCAGVAVATLGLRAATSSRRPGDLAGALAAALGLTAALVGAATIAAPGFLF